MPAARPGPSAAKRGQTAPPTAPAAPGHPAGSRRGFSTSALSPTNSPFPSRAFRSDPGPGRGGVGGLTLPMRSSTLSRGKERMAAMVRMSRSDSEYLLWMLCMIYHIVWVGRPPPPSPPHAPGGSHRAPGARPSPGPPAMAGRGRKSCPGRTERRGEKQAVPGWGSGGSRGASQGSAQSQRGRSRPSGRRKRTATRK